MRQIPVDASALQEQTFAQGDETLRLTLRWSPVGACWFMDVYSVSREDWVVQSAAVVCGIPLLWRSPVDYFLVLTDESGVDLDPMVPSDLGRRCLLYIGDKSEVSV